MRTCLKRSSAVKVGLRDDILWRNASGAVAIWLMNGGVVQSTTEAALEPGAVPGNDWQIQGTGDFNRFIGSIASDILWRNLDGTVAIWLLHFGGTQVEDVYPALAPGTRPGNDWQVQGTGDFNGDTKSDILWRNTDGTVAIWLMDGGNVLAAPTVELTPGARPGNDWQIQGTGDFNRDRMSDILWRNTDGTVATWLLDGGTVLAATTPALVPGARPGNDWHIRGVGDFNGDLTADLLWQNNNSVVAIWLMTGGNVLVDVYPW